MSFLFAEGFDSYAERDPPLRQPSKAPIIIELGLDMGFAVVMAGEREASERVGRVPLERAPDGSYVWYGHPIDLVMEATMWGDEPPEER